MGGGEGQKEEITKVDEEGCRGAEHVHGPDYEDGHNSSNCTC